MRVRLASPHYEKGHLTEYRKSGSHQTPRWREGDSNPRSPRRIDDAQRAPFRLCGTSCPPGEPSRFTRWRRFESHLPLPAKLLGNEFTRVPPKQPGFGGVLRVHKLSSAGSLPGMQSAARRSRWISLPMRKRHKDWPAVSGARIIDRTEQHPQGGIFPSSRRERWPKNLSRSRPSRTSRGRLLSHRGFLWWCRLLPGSRLRSRRIEGIFDGLACVEPHRLAGCDLDGLSGLRIPPPACGPRRHIENVIAVEMALSIWAMRSF
jgi:hypothetical protein